MSIITPDRPTDRRPAPPRAEPTPARSLNVPTLVTDTMTVMTRELRPTLRNPFSVIFTMVQPLFFLALFGPLLISVTGAGTAATLQTFVPGILVMSALFAASTTGSNLLLEIQTGSHERMLVTPLSRSSLLLGRALKEIVPLVAQASIIVAVVIPFGFRLELGGAVIGMAMLAVFGVGLGALSYTLALAVQSEDWIFWSVQQTLIFPLLLLSGMLLPLDDAPGWLQALSKINPLTHIVDAERALFAGDVTDPVVLWGALSAAGLALVGLTVGIRAMQRATN
ncbi:MAG TPA: ABC transporter permease [Acidimicrobiales bacterium]